MTGSSSGTQTAATIERRRQLVADQPMGEFYRRLAEARAAEVTRAA